MVKPKLKNLKVLKLGGLGNYLRIVKEQAHKIVGLTANILIDLAS